MGDLTIRDLKAALVERLFSNPAYKLSTEWTTAQWLQALVGEVGEFANINKKVDRGDLTPLEAMPKLEKELADILAYTLLLSDQLGINAAEVSINKFNEISDRIECPVKLADYEVRVPDLVSARRGKTMQEGMTKEEALEWCHVNLSAWADSDCSDLDTPEGWNWREFGPKPVLCKAAYLNRALGNEVMITYAEWAKTPLQEKDVGSHYRFSHQQKITEEDMERGYVVVKMDPYRVCKLYGVGGGAREHLIKKALRGAGKGHTELELINELKSCLKRWEEMHNEDN